jgi:hypothetical protein
VARRKSGSGDRVGHGPVGESRSSEWVGAVRSSTFSPRDRAPTRCFQWPNKGQLAFHRVPPRGEVPTVPVFGDALGFSTLKGIEFADFSRNRPFYLVTM